MKSHQRYILGLFLAAAMLIVAGCNHYDAPDTLDAVPESTNISIAELRNKVGKSGQMIEQELIIGGYVTSSDKAGNFYRTFTIEDFSGGAEIMAGLYDLHNLFPIGYYVVVHLKGCTVALNEGVLQIGREPKSYSNYPTDYFASRQALDKHITCYDVVRQIAPTPRSIASLKEEECGKLVTISGLALCSSLHSEGWQVNADGEWMGYNFFCDEKGNQVAVYTSEYATYANERIPTDRVALIGILHYGKADGGDYYMIKMRDEGDCQILH